MGPGEESGIEPYNPARPLSRALGARPATPPPSPLPPSLLRTPRTALYVDKVVDCLYETEKSPRTVRAIIKLAKGTKQALAEIDLQARREEALLEANKHRKSKKRKITTTRGVFLTREVADGIMKELREKTVLKNKAERLRIARGERLKELQEKGILKKGGRLPKGRLVVLPCKRLVTETTIEDETSSESSIDSEEAPVEV